MTHNDNLCRKLQELSEAVKYLPGNAQQSVLHQIDVLTTTVNNHINTNDNVNPLTDAKPGDDIDQCNTERMYDSSTHIEMDSSTKWIQSFQASDTTESDGINQEEREHYDLDQEKMPTQTRAQGSFKKTFVDIEENGQRVIKAEVITKEVERDIHGEIDDADNIPDAGDIEDYIIDEKQEESYEVSGSRAPMMGKKHNNNMTREKCHERLSAKCLVCRRKFQSTQMVREHMRVDHNIVLNLQEKVKNTEPCMCPQESTTAELEFSCNSCPKKFKAEIGLKQHIARYHTNSLSTECDICHKQYDHYKKLMAHKRAAHNTCYHACQHCDYKTKYSMDLKRHIMRRHGRYEDFPYQCQVCQKRFVMPNAYKRHVRTHQTEREFIYCEYQGCQYKTISESTMFLHVKKIHKGIVNTYECEICHATLGNKQTYKIHMRRHKGDNPYTCSVCSVGFPCASQLTAHEKIHGEKTEACSVCGKKFLDKAKVKRHMAVHSDEKKFKCPWCPYKCNMDSNLRKHCQARHNELYPPKVRKQVSSFPRNVAPFRFKRDLTSSFARSIVMALSKADPAQLASMSEGQNGDSGPILYLDTANNQIILRTEQSGPALEIHPKFTLREENGQYILVQIPPNDDKKHVAPASSAPYIDSIQTSVDDTTAHLHLQGQDGTDYLATAMTTITNTTTCSPALEPSQIISYIQNTCPAQGQTLQENHENQHQGSAPRLNGVEMPSLLTEAVHKTEDIRVVGAGEDSGKDTELVLTEETLQQLSATAGGSLVLVQPDGSTYELEFSDNKYTIKPYNPVAEDLSNIKQEAQTSVGILPGTAPENHLSDPDQYIHTLPSTGIITNENLNDKIESGKVLDESGILNNVGEGVATPLTIVQTGTSINVIYAQSEVAAHESAASTHELQMHDSVVINPQDFVNKI